MERRLNLHSKRREKEVAIGVRPLVYYRDLKFLNVPEEERKAHDHRCS
jgi:hypothetical protein